MDAWGDVELVVALVVSIVVLMVILSWFDALETYADGDHQMTGLNGPR